MPTATHEQLEEIALKALDMLRPFGFELADDSENPALLWHPRIKLSVDVSSLAPEAVFDVIAERMRERGYRQAQADIRSAMGVAG